MTLFSLARPLLHMLPPETAHEMTLRALEAGVYPRAAPDDPRLAVRMLGLDFPNPVGIAAGFDKDARVPDAVLGLGCGFAEIGTVTPLPQPGNPPPRLFRLPADGAVINRLGFNNAGHEAALARLQQRPRRGIVGVNIGANKDATDRIGDYVKGLETFNEVASYFTVNISSPNTPGLRDLQAPEALDALLDRLMAARERLALEGRPRRPVVVKLAPDVAEADLPAILACILAHGVDAIAVSNTTLARPALADPRRTEAGGLSGRPLFERSTIMLARVYQETAGRIPLIGIGGIDGGPAAVAKIEAGASLVQLYTALVYKGPELIGAIKQALLEAVAQRRVGSVLDLVGRDAAHWAAKALA